MVDMFAMPQAAVKHGIELKAISKKVKGTDGERCGSFVCSVIPDLASFLYDAWVIICR
jgi:hypothetical protein